MNEIVTHANKKSVGDMLKGAREKKGLVFADVQKFIKIHPKYLQALESNDYSVFSGSVHVKGFLKIYSKFLGLNVDEVLAFFRREYDEKTMGKGRIVRPLDMPRFMLTPSLVIAFVSITLVFGFFAYLFYQYRSYTGAPILVIEKPMESVTSSDTSFEVVGRTDRDSTVFLNGQTVTTAPDGSFVTRIELGEGINTLNFLSVSKLGKQTRVLRTVVLKKNDFAPVFGKASKVVLDVSAAKGSSVVVVIADGAKTFEGTMLLDTTRTFEATQSIKLKSLNAGALAIKVNGLDAGTFGKPGEVKEQEFK